MNSQQLDRIFSALADPTRRGILASLSMGARNVRQLTADFAISQPAISRHLRVLDQAGLVRREKRGRETVVSAQSGSAEEAASWLTYYVQFWRQHFDEMDRLLPERVENRDAGRD
ncbi:MAG: metalloregulator ArsR/SmtB family transcription factor [Pseudomonadota bacterium]